jgi:hypothetical protein
MMPITGGMPNTEAVAVAEVVGKQDVSFEGALQQSGFEVIADAPAGADCNNIPVNKIDILQIVKVTPNGKLLPSFLLDQGNVGGGNTKVTVEAALAEPATMKKIHLVTDPTTQEQSGDEEIATEIPAANIPVTAQDPAQTTTPHSEFVVLVPQQFDDSVINDIKLPQSKNAEVLPVGHEAEAGNHKTSTAIGIGKNNSLAKKVRNRNLDSPVTLDASSAAITAADLEPTKLQAHTISLPNVDGQKPGTAGVASGSLSKSSLRPREHAAATTILATQGESIMTTSADAMFVPPNEINVPVRTATEAESPNDNNLNRIAEVPAPGTTVAVSHISAEQLTLSIAPGPASSNNEAPSPFSASVSSPADLRNDAYGNVGGFAHESGRMTHGAMTASTTAQTTSLEVGVASGTHGWLRVRAELEDGVVTASLASSSVASREALHRELPSLATYLREGQVGVGAVVVRDTSAAERRDGFSSSNFSGQGQQSQTQEQSRNRSSSPAAAWGPSDEEASQQVLRTFGTAGVLPSSFAGSTGGWLNVRV